MTSHWLIHSLHEGPGCAGNAPGFLISIVLDDNTQCHFSAIRLLIVHVQSTWLDNVKIEECHDTKTISSISRSGLKRPISYRSFLHKKQSILSSHASSLPILTIVFEMVPSSGRLGTISLEPHTQLGLDTSNFQVAYEHIQACSPTSSSLSLFFFSSNLVERVPQHLRAHGRSTGIRAHSVRVIPITGRRPFAFLLPPDVITLIVELATGIYLHGWRRRLLSYGLVCKSWTPVLDLFFQIFHKGYDTDNDKPAALFVARSLDVRPERAALLRTFNIWDFRPRRPQSYSDLAPLWTADEWQAFLTILQYATSIQTAGFSYVKESMGEKLLHTLSRLRDMRRFRLTSFDDNVARPVCSILQIQTCMVNWQHLRVLDLRSWVESKDTEINSLPHLPCKIEELRLADGALTGPQLRRLTASPIPHLRTLYFESIHGYSNQDFFLFLASVASTLVEISLVNMRLAPRTSYDEELALDAIMPKLQSIRRINLNGSHASTLAISRKLVSEVRGENMQNTCSFFIRPSLEGPWSMGDLEAAMGVTGWEQVAINWQQEWDYDEMHFQRIASVAEKRGVGFNIWPS